MSLYNMLFGRNPLAHSLLAMLNLTEFDVGRFRDCFLVAGEDGPEICVYTRNGGGNRQDYQAVFDALSKHPLYLGDADDVFDCTYATIKFKPPESMRAWLADLVKGEDQRTPAERWKELLHKMQTKPDDPDVKRAFAAAEPLFAALNEAMAEPEAGAGPSVKGVSGGNS